MRGRFQNWQHFNRDDHKFSMKWGENYGNTNVSMFFSFYDRDRVAAAEDEIMGMCDYDALVPDQFNSAFYRCSSNSAWGQFDMSGTAPYTDGSGEFLIKAAGDPNCILNLGNGTCAASDSSGNYTHNWNGERDVLGDVQRHNMFLFVNHDLGNGNEVFAEIGQYRSKYNGNRHSSSSFSSVKHVVPATNPYNFTGKALLIDNYRFVDAGPRIVDNDKETNRLLAGIRGDLDSGWSWESAISYSWAEAFDVTHNRVSNTLIDALLHAQGPGAYNPFNGAGGSHISGRVSHNPMDLTDGGIAPAVVDVYRANERTMTTLDLRMSKADWWETKAGFIGMAWGLETREDTFVDDRDPRLDGTIVFTERKTSGALSTSSGDTYPYVSDVVNSSPTPDSRGGRTVNSFYIEFDVPVVSPEMNVPLVEQLDLQVAWRKESYSDFDGTNAPRVAFGWRVSDIFKLRGSFQETFRAPNLITINESMVVRNNTRNDAATIYAIALGADTDDSDGRYSVQRQASGSSKLQAETSDNTTVGFVLEPTDSITLTYDVWSIESENTIGLFGEENHMLLDLYLRLQQNNLADCSSVVGNPAVVRQTPDNPETFIAAGLCPFGLADRVEDNYANLNNRTIEGWDSGFYYDTETAFGTLSFKHQISQLTAKMQEYGPTLSMLDAAMAGGEIPLTAIDGFGDILAVNGAPKRKTYTSLRLRRGDWAFGMNQNARSTVYEDRTLSSAGAMWAVVPFKTRNMYVDYYTETPNTDLRIRLGVNNWDDKRAPLASSRMGYFEDLDNNLRRNFYLDLRFTY
jgi:iron complex outermembrane receptor protein